MNITSIGARKPKIPNLHMRYSTFICRLFKFWEHVENAGVAHNYNKLCKFSVSTFQAVELLNYRANGYQTVFPTKVFLMAAPCDHSSLNILTLISTVFSKSAQLSILLPSDKKSDCIAYKWSFWWQIKHIHRKPFSSKYIYFFSHIRWGNPAHIVFKLVSIKTKSYAAYYINNSVLQVRTDLKITEKHKSLLTCIAQVSSFFKHFLSYKCSLFWGIKHRRLR